MCRYCWPGNVRELENVIKRALVLGDGDVVKVDDLPERLGQHPPLEWKSTKSLRLADVERDHIARTLDAVWGNKAAAARVLGLNRKTLYRKADTARDCGKPSPPRR